MLRTVILHGEAGTLFGKRWKLDVDTLAEAIRAIGVQRQGFQQYVESRDFQCVLGKRKDGLEMDDRMITLNMGNDRELHILPMLMGAGGKAGGIGKIIAGVLLAGFAFFAAPAMGMTAFAGMSMKSVGMIGIGLIGSGVSALMSPQKKDEKDDSSKLFSGIPQSATQGICVPVAVGRSRAKMRSVISGRIITAAVSGTGSTISTTGKRATGSISMVPAWGDRITVKGITYFFLRSFEHATSTGIPVAHPRQDQTIPVSRLLTILRNRSDLKDYTFNQVGSRIEITAKEVGTAYNGLALSTLSPSRIIIVPVTGGAN